MWFFPAFSLRTRLPEGVENYTFEQLVEEENASQKKYFLWKLAPAVVSLVSIDEDTVSYVFKLTRSTQFLDDKPFIACFNTLFYSTFGSFPSYHQTKFHFVDTIVQYGSLRKFSN